jgi:outer membrane biosynthesis protein TonB
MSREADGSMSGLWPRWQGHVINGVGRLGGCLGYSDHSGVFLTESATRRPSVVAVKLVPTDRALTESLLPRWRRAAGLTHSHLIRMWDLGGCQLDGLPHLYAVLEYADQTLAQVLLRRALTDTEAREMLLPTLHALAFVHGQNLVHGQLKPANILVVGDQLKLASDTVRRAREGPVRTHGPAMYDPPEVRQGRSSPASDIWALGVTLFEALTRRPPSDLGEPGKAIVLPGDFPAEFRDVVARCLSPSPQERPSVTELLAWAGGKSSLDAPPLTIQPTAVTQLEPGTLEPAASRSAPPPVAPEAPEPGSTDARSRKPRALLSVLLAGVGILALAWGGGHLIRTARNSAAPLAAPLAASPAAARAIVGAPAEPAAQTTDAPANAAAEVPPAISAPSSPTPGRADLATSPSALHEEIPEIPRSARQTIRGHIKVWVRIIVDQNGSVLATVADRTGPSRYFLRLAVQAAKKWQFPPAQTPSRRLMQVRFDFSRDGVTGRAVTLP